MYFSQNSVNHPDILPQKNKSKNKMIKTRNTHSQKSSIKNVAKPSQKVSSQIVNQQITPNFLIKQKYFRPAIKQYQKADANMITRCIHKDFDDFEYKSMDLYEFVQFYTVKKTLKKYEEGILYSFQDKFMLISPVNNYNSSISKHIFHFYGQSFHILQNRVIKLKSLQIHHNTFKSEKGSSIKNRQQKKNSKSKSKQKLKNTDSVLKGIFDTNKKSSQSSSVISKIKKVNKMLGPRKTHIISKDSQDVNHLIHELSILLKTHSIENFSQMSTQQETVCSQKNDFQINISVILGPETTSKKSKAKEIAKNNEFTQIMQSQSSHISALKNSEIISNPNQFQFYGLSSIRDKKMKKQQKNSTKNESYFANGQHSTNQSLLTNKRTSTNHQFSHIFSEQTPKKPFTNPIQIYKHKQEVSKKSKSNSKNLRKGTQSKSKCKSLSSTQKSLRKDQSGGLAFKNKKLLSNANSAKNISERLLFMEPLNEKEIRKTTLPSSIRANEQRKDSKSKSKGKMILLKR